VTGAILVGGAGRRLGGAVKPSLRIGGETIVERQMRAFHEAGVTHVSVVGRWAAVDRTSATVHHIADAVPDCGALGGLYTALLASPGDAVIVVAGDMPFITGGWLRELANLDAHDAKVPRVGRTWHPLCGAYRRRLAGLIKARLDRGAMRVTDALQDFRVLEVTNLEPHDPTGMLLMNVNTPDDLREAERLARLHI
jgi:molybdopterin-guanine dinucleotide biosynthesis protein A